ncbi:hypothetical protein P3342_001672 [Pyrenophora teres f. teres]|nr:hypothetical protein P3342_001672 [Pyrenophora teres f. teres]
MAAADASAVGLAVQITQLHHDGMDEPTTQARVQEAFHIWTTNTTVNPNEQPPAWLATPAIQPTNTVNTAKRRRQPDPDMFDGTRKQYQVFYQQLTAKVENDKNDFEDDKMACDYAFARLKGTAATLTLPYMNQMRISGKWDLTNSLDSLTRSRRLQSEGKAKAQKEELNSDEESSGVDTPEEDSDWED